MAASLVAATLTTNTVVAALFDSLIERLVNRVSYEIPAAIENSIKKYAIDNNTNPDTKYIRRHHALLLNELATKSATNTENKDNNNNNTASNNDIFFCNSVLKLVDERLKTLEILQMADLNVSLSHLSDAKHALHMNNVTRFRYFIEQSYLKAREALYKITNLLYKIYVYSILIFDGFMMFSDFGTNLKNGLYFIKKLLSEIQSDHTLNEMLNKSLNSWRWNTFDKTLIGHSILFSTKISSLIRAIKNKINQQHNTETATTNEIDETTKELKLLFNDIQNNCTVLKTIGINDNDGDEKYDMNIAELRDETIINDIESWIPNIWNGYFFGVNSKQQNTVIQAKHYLNLFQMQIAKENEQNEGNLNDLWFCESTNFIYEYMVDTKMWFTVSDALLFDYYYHRKIHNKKEKINKKFNIKAFNDHFNKYIIEDRLIIRKKWSSIHPKLKLLLKDYLTHKNISLHSNIRNISTLDLSFNDKLFGLDGIKYICNAINVKNSPIKTLKIAKNDLDFKCIQLFVIGLLSIPIHCYSSLTQLNISYNTQIEDNSIYLLLNKGIAKKCPHLKKLYIQWTNVSDLTAKYIVNFYELYPYHTLCELYLNGNKNITSQGAIMLNAALQGIIRNRVDIMINISDCKINVSQLVLFDKRLIVNN